MKPAIDVSPERILAIKETAFVHDERIYNLIRAYIIAMYTEKGKVVYVVVAADGPIRRNPNEAHLLADNEGVTWCRGHSFDSPAANALRVSLALRGEP
ncbi:MAG TPA: hypothetical protein VGY48_15425 [Vicinamibacterales bacterium]|nr:hypothetical protein [Vicinamibacterales bacterium]